MNKNTFKYIREIHRIPKSQKLAWCIIHYPDAERPERCHRLGVLLVGTDKAIDLADAVFIQNRSDQKAVIATREKDGDWYRYISEDGFVLRLPYCFISDMYFSRVYSRDLMDGYLF